MLWWVVCVWHGRSETGTKHFFFISRPKNLKIIIISDFIYKALGFKRKRLGHRRGVVLGLDGCRQWKDYCDVTGHWLQRMKRWKCPKSEKQKTEIENFKAAQKKKQKLQTAWKEKIDFGTMMPPLAMPGWRHRCAEGLLGGTVAGLTTIGVISCVGFMASKLSSVSNICNPIDMVNMEFTDWPPE